MLVEQLRYSAWATKRVLESTASVPPEEYRRDLYSILSHIYQADSIWFDRLVGRPTSNLAAYEAPVEHSALADRWMAVHDRYIAWAQSLDADRVVAYRNIKGEAFESPVWQIVLHVVNHATYHRGQVTTMLRQLGRTPVSTDLIAYYRSEAAHA